MKCHPFRHALIPAASLLLVLFVYAGPKDFWEAKPYTEWSAKEVETLLEKNSPWTQTTLMILDAGGGGGGGRGGRSGGGGGATPSALPTKVVINWYARPIREALVRRSMLQGLSAPQEQIDQFLNQDSDFLELMLTGISVGRGRQGGAGLEQFKEQTFLQKKNKDKISLVDVVMPKEREAATVLRFAREIDGKPTVTVEDQEVTLNVRINNQTYKYKFKLADMMIKGKLEI
jgi:hypothetical protein